MPYIPSGSNRNKEIDGWMDGWTDGQTDRQTDRQVGG
jgi:hypothetical protein